MPRARHRCPALSNTVDARTRTVLTNGVKEKNGSGPAAPRAGMQPWDITMSDILSGRATLDAFQGLIFVGGFSYADVLDSAKGWASAVRFNAAARRELDAFAARADTFSLGVCNGCQLMALLGWVPRGADGSTLAGGAQPRFVHNTSGAPSAPRPFTTGGASIPAHARPVSISL